MNTSKLSAVVRNPFIAAIAVAIGLIGASGPAPAGAQPLETGISGMGEHSPAAFSQVAATGARFVRISAPWQDVAPKTKPDSWNPSDPADPHYNWDFLDEEIIDTVKAGFEPLLLVEGAPTWAQGCTSPPGLQYVDVCDPSATALAEFATAAARRYSGNFQNLPRVRYWQGLNEPNLTLFFFPQFSADGKPLSASLYRPLINSFYAAVKSVDPSNLVVMAGLGPIAIRGYTVGPMQFTRELLCMRGSKNPKPIKGQCDGGVHFDIFDIHPYTTGGPTHTGGPNDVELGDMPKLQRLIVAADRAGHIQGSVAHTQIWVAEFSWDSRPPDPGGLPMKIETRWIAEALHVSWLAGVSNFFWYSLRDDPRDPNLTFSQTHESGLYFRGATVAQDRPKPAMQAFRFPFVAYPGKKGLSFWGRTPASRRGKVLIMALRRGKWRKIGSTRASKFGIFRGTVHSSYGADKKGAVKAIFAHHKSPAFAMKPVPDFFQKPFG